MMRGRKRSEQFRLHNISISNYCADTLLFFRREIRKKFLAFLVFVIVLFGMVYARADIVVIQDGSNHTFSDNTYENDSVYLDYTISAGTHVDLVNGGSVSNLGAYNSATITMTGGSVEWNLGANDSSTITISGGSVPTFEASDNSTATILGGVISNGIIAYLNATITVSGGSLGPLLTKHDATIFLNGTDFQADGDPLMLGDKLSDFGTLDTDAFGDYYTGTVTGILSDSSALNTTFKIYNTGINAGTADIIIIPEPATIFMLGLGALTLLRKKHKYKINPT